MRSEALGHRGTLRAISCGRRDCDEARNVNTTAGRGEDMSHRYRSLRSSVLLAVFAALIAGCSLFNQGTSGTGTGTAPGATLGQIVTAAQIDPSTNAPVQ